MPARGQIEAAFETVAQVRIGALAVAASPFFDTRRDTLVALAARHAVPTMYHFREFAAAGGLMSYGIDPVDAYRQVGVYAVAFLRVRSLQTCRCCNRPNSSSF